MNSSIISLFVVLLLGFSSVVAQDTPTPGLPAGMVGSYETVKVKVEKVFKATGKKGGKYRAYQALWNEQTIIVNDMLAQSEHEVGDEITIIVQEIDTGDGEKILQFVFIDFAYASGE